MCHLRELGDRGGEGVCVQSVELGGVWYLHVHDVCFMQRLMFDLWVDDGWVGDPCGVGTRGAGHHVV